MGIRVAVVLVAVISLHEHCPTASAGWGDVDWRLSSMRTRRFRNGAWRQACHSAPSTRLRARSFQDRHGGGEVSVAPGCSLAGGVVIFGVAAG